MQHLPPGKRLVSKLPVTFVTVNHWKVADATDHFLSEEKEGQQFNQQAYQLR
jgi:hypothetical protein